MAQQSNKLLDGYSLLAIKDYIDNRVVSAYEFRGTVATTTALLNLAPIAKQNGYVYNVTTGGTITQTINGSSVSTVIANGDNVAWVTADNSSDSVTSGGYWSVLAGFIDASLFITPSELNTALADYVDKTSSQSISGKKTFNEVQINKIDAGTTLNSVDNSQLDFIFGDPNQGNAYGMGLAFTYLRQNNENGLYLTTYNNSNLILNPHDNLYIFVGSGKKAYYGGETDSKEIVVKENIVAYTKQQALNILNGTDTLPTE